MRIKGIFHKHHLIAIAICLVGGMSIFPNRSTATELKVLRLPGVVKEKARLLNQEYLAATPEVAHGDKKYPLLIFLHGAGGRGSDIQKVKRIAQAALMGMERYAGEPSIFVAPQVIPGAPGNRQSWVPDELNVFLEHLKSTLPIDSNRIYLTGNSMGGFGTWYWASHSPKQFAAAAPIVGGLGEGGPKEITPNLDQWANNLVNLPLWAFHGEQDRVVPADRSKRMIDMIQKQGGKLARLTIFPNEGHGASRRVYTSEDFYQWLYAQNSEQQIESAQTTPKQGRDSKTKTEGDQRQKGVDGLAPEVPDLSAEDVSFQLEHQLPYLDEPFIDSSPEDKKDGIDVGVLGIDGGDKESILKFARSLGETALDPRAGNTDSLLICYRGKLILESYYRRGRVNYPHYQMSITKSYTAMVIGRAIQLGYLSMADLDKPITAFLNELDSSKLTGGANQITLHQAMHMRSGVRIDPDIANQLRRRPEELKGQRQVEAYLANSDPIPPAPREFKYQSSDPTITMQIVEAVVPGNASEFIREQLWGPLGVENYQWQQDVSGLPKSAAGSSIRSRDMLKMGLLVLNHGQWKGKQLIPAEFIQRATNGIRNNSGASSYGYFWWTQDYEIGERTYHSIQGRGAGGQFLFIFPSIKLVVVVTAHNKGMGSLLRQLPQTLLPSFVHNLANTTEGE